MYLTLITLILSLEVGATIVKSLNVRLQNVEENKALSCRYDCVY